MSEQNKHPEWTKENSLTSPADRDKNNRWRPEQGAAQLTESQITEAYKSLNNTDFVDKFPRVDRTYADPPVSMQNIGLVSFVPAKGATPNKNGVFGFAKLRGNYQTATEANQRAEFIVRNCDSYHQIYHTYVGRPFPITSSSKYSAETEEIDIRKETTKAISQSVKDKKASERKQVKSIKEREEALLEESKNDEVDPYDLYITLRVKQAQLTWTYLEHQKKIKEIKEILIKTRSEIKGLDEEHEDFKDKYMAKYLKARKDAGIKESKQEEAKNFMQYLGEDVDLGF
jgi:hypothetical protein